MRCDDRRAGLLASTAVIAYASETMGGEAGLTGPGQAGVAGVSACAAGASASAVRAVASWRAPASTAVLRLPRPAWPVVRTVCPWILLFCGCEKEPGTGCRVYGNWGGSWNKLARDGTVAPL